MYTNIPSNICW